jgi:hypothetical protein
MVGGVEEGGVDAGIVAGGGMAMNVARRESNQSLGRLLISGGEGLGGVLAILVFVEGE